MPDLEERIADWRKRMAAGGVKFTAVLDELESHLREEVQARLAAGDSESVAFHTAAARLGSAGSLQAEFNRVSGAASLPVLITASIWIGAVALMLAVFSNRLVTGRMGLLLVTHVLTITSGYLAAFLAGALAICYICCRWAGRLRPDMEQAMNRAVIRFSYVSAIMTITGFLMGMAWTHKYRGGTWQNDPREYGALVVCGWYGFLCLAYSYGKVSDHARMVLSVIGNMIVAQAWFGAGFLVANPAMHWYGVVNYLPLQLFMGAHVLFLFMGISRKLESVET